MTLLLGKQKLFNNPTNVLKALPFPHSGSQTAEMNPHECRRIKQTPQNLFVVPQIFIY